MTERLVVVVKTATFDRSMSFYRDVLGFRVEEEWHDAGHGATLVAVGGAAVELLDMPDEPPISTADSLFVGLQVAEVDSIHRLAVEGGFEIVREPADRPWGGRGLVVRDPNGLALNVYTAYGTGSGDAGTARG